MVDTEYLTNGKWQIAAEHVDKCIQSLDIKGISKKSYSVESGMTLICYVIEPSEGVTKNVMLYGHLDKQPYGDGWHEWLDGPTDPVIKDGRMYGRGASDDGYAPFTCMLAVKCA